MADQSSAAVHRIESLQRLHEQLLDYAGNVALTADELQNLVRRIESIFNEHRPRYWAAQGQLAQQRLSEARDTLARKRAAIRPGDRPAATEATKQVQWWETRVRLCTDKQRACKSVALKIQQSANQLLGPIADVRNHGESVLPVAAVQLAALIDQVKRYLQS